MSDEKVVSIQSKREEIQRRIDAELYRRILARVDHLKSDIDKAADSQESENHQ